MASAAVEVDFEYDHAELAKLCKDAGFPEPPDLSAMQKDSAVLLLSQIRKAAGDPSAENVGQLGMIYSALASSRADTDRAIACYEKAKELDPKSHVWPYCLARTFLYRKSNARARIELDQTRELNPDYAMAYSWLGRLALNEKLFDEAREHFKKFCELRPDDAYGYSEMAAVDLEQGNLDAARTQIDKAIELDPTNGWAHSLSSRHYAKTGDKLNAARQIAMAQSLPMYPRTLERDPVALKQWRSVGATDVALSQLNMLAKVGDMTSARILSDALLTDNPNNINLLAGIARFEMFQGEAGKAIPLAKAAKKLDSGSVNVSVTLAHAYLLTRRNDDALVEIDRAVQLDDRYALAHRIRGEVLLAMGRMEDAKDAFMLDRKLAPENPESARRIAQIWYRLGDMEKTVEFYKKAILSADVGNHPKSMSAPFHAGIAEALVTGGDTEAAIASYKRAITADPKQTVIFSRFVEILLKEERNDEALQYCVRAIGLNPEILSYQFLRVEVLERIGRQDEALAGADALQKTNSSNPNVYLLRGSVLNKMGRNKGALEDIESAIALNPKLEGGHVALVELFLTEGAHREVIIAVKRGLEYVPDSVRLSNTGAWVLATAKDESLRDPKEAIKMAELACQKTQRKIASCLDTLACAYASDGRFDDAVIAMTEAVELASTKPEMSEQLVSYEKRMSMFKNKQAYIDDPK
ncbi:MAG: tetratricopeptide repeat protein [Planctomycetes bacterium]|nr:tetratricopeptide repeat protein [Planctomycetota bacterium]